MAEQDDNQTPGPGPSPPSDSQIGLASVENSGMLPANEREASNIAHEFRSLASRVGSFPIQPTEKISDEAANVARMSRNLATRVERGFKVRFDR